MKNKPNNLFDFILNTCHCTFWLNSDIYIILSDVFTVSEITLSNRWQGNEGWSGKKKLKAGLCLLIFSQGNIWFATAFPFAGILGCLGFLFSGN